MWKHATCDDYDFALTNDVLSAAIDFDRKPTRQQADGKLKSLVRRIQTENLQCHVIFGCSIGRSGGSGGSRKASSTKSGCAFRTLDRQALHDHVAAHEATVSLEVREAEGVKRSGAHVEGSGFRVDFQAADHPSFSRGPFTHSYYHQSLEGPTKTLSRKRGSVQPSNSEPNCRFDASLGGSVVSSVPIASVDPALPTLTPVYVLPTNVSPMAGSSK